MFQLRMFCLLCAGILLAGTQLGFFVTAKITPSGHRTAAVEVSDAFMQASSDTSAQTSSSTQANTPHIIRPQAVTMAAGETRIIPGTLHTPVFSCCSSSPKTVSVSPGGIITAQTAGRCDILYHTSDGFYSLRITVLTEEEAHRTDSSYLHTETEIPVELSEKVLFMEPGDSYQVSPSEEVSSGRASLRWESEDRSVAQVNSSGEITAQGKGSTVITCSNGSNSASVYVNVVTRDYNGNTCDFSILTANGNIRTYRLYKQNAHNYPKYDSYLAWHGCATCSLTSVLGAYNPVYANILPSEVIDGPEKDTVSARAWNREHKERSLPRQMPLSLYGITSILEKHGVAVDYVRTYSSDEEATNDIISHLKTGNPVIFEVRQKSNITGKKSSRWTNSYHTMVLLGVLTNGKVLIYDPVDKNWDNNGNRITITDLSDVMEFMFPCTKIDQAMYYNGAASDGGYIKVFDAVE